MGTLTLDSTDPDVNQVTSQWTKGGKYRVEVLITQTSEPGQPFVATVDEVTDYGDVEPEEEAAPTTPPLPPAPNATKVQSKKAAY